MPVLNSGKASLSLSVVLAFLLVQGCENGRHEEEDLERPQVRFLRVQPEVVVPEVVLTGTVVSREIARVHPDVTGVLVRVRVREGDAVRRGDVLAEIDPEPFRLNARMAEAEYLKARSELDRILRGYRPEEIEAARSLYENAKALYRSRAENLERNRVLYQSGAMTQKDWVVFQAQLAASEALVRKSSAELTKMLQGYESYDIQAASAAVSLAQAKHSLALRNLKHTTVRAPITGIVTRRKAELGELVGPGNELFVIQDPENVWLVADASLRDAPRIRPGQEVSLKSQTGTAEGFVDRISRFLDRETRTMRVWMAWEDGRKVPPLGAFASGLVHVDPLPEGISLRREWVHLERGEHFVWILQEDRLKKRVVTIGEDQGDRVVVRTGLNPGEKVVISPPSSFEEDLQVLSQEYRPPASPGQRDTLSISMSSREIQ